MTVRDADFRSIMAEYADIREKNLLLHEEREREVTEKIPEYKELSDKAAALASDYGKKAVSGDDGALDALNKELSVISEKKQALLTSAGFPADYLDPVYDCPDCKDSGYIEGRKCHCLKQRMVNMLYLQSHIMDVLETENFSRCDMSLFSGEVREDMDKVYETAKAFVDTFGEDFKNLLFLGNVGSGKTFLTNCIAKALLDRGFSVVYFSAFRLFSMLSDNIFRQTDQDEKDSFFSNIYDSDLLIIDDLGTENVNSFVMNQLFNILNERQLRRNPTLISSNLSLKKIKDIYSERSLSRIIGNYELYYFRGEDLRMKK